MADQPWPPYIGKFIVEVDGQEIGTFTEVSGLSVEVKSETIPEGGENSYVHKVPGRMEWPNLVLKRGLTKSNNLFDWFQKTSGTGFAGQGNKLGRTTAAVVLINARGARVRTWTVDGAFPVKWTGPSFAAAQAEAATEELEIAHHGFVVS